MRASVERWARAAILHNGGAADRATRAERSDGAMKLACVVHRFGADIAGGSEGHCRLVAQHLAPAKDVTIVTTCAKDHITRRKHFIAGASLGRALRVLRFPAGRGRSRLRFMVLVDT